MSWPGLWVVGESCVSVVAMVLLESELIARSSFRIRSSAAAWERVLDEKLVLELDELMLIASLCVGGGHVLGVAILIVWGRASAGGNQGLGTPLFFLGSKSLVRIGAEWGSSSGW